MRFCLLWELIVLTLAPTFGQSPADGPKFLGADIHTSARIFHPLLRGPFLAANRYELHYASMVDLISLAYDVEPQRIDGGPAWIEMDRFDITAKTPSRSTAASRKLMLKALLAERFHLATHETTKPLPAWALTAGSHSGLKEANGSGASGCRVRQSYQAGSVPVISIECTNATMAVFTSTLASAAWAGGYFEGKPLIDRTGLEESWDFTFRYTQKLAPSAQVGGENLPLPKALEKQLGLKLELSTTPATVIAIDSVDEKPTPNPAGLAEILPPLPTEFEVASVKPVPRQAVPQYSPLQIKNGRFVAPNVTVRTLIQNAWALFGERVAGPKWIDEDRFDINAKVPSEVAVGESEGASDRSNPLNIDVLQPILRTLLISRFKMEFHMEDRPLNTLVLTAPKPKLTGADRSQRSTWFEGTAGADPKIIKNPTRSFGRVVTCRNVSMSQFARLLPEIAGGYVYSEVLDETGLEGGWDFSFSFTPRNLLNQRNGNRDPGEAPEPNGAISLPEALMQQVGLKFDTAKRPGSVLVIDKIERTPTEN